jgi:predicted Zn-dependent protease
MNLTMRIISAAVVFWMALQPTALSARPAVIRDAEIENIIRGYATPLLQAAGIAPGDARLILVRDNQINAFVAGGMNIFIYTGLLRSVDSPDEIRGVLAHEIGHIAGGHIARLGAELEQASTQALLSTILGVAVAVAAGRADAGAAVIAGGSGSAQRGLLAHTRAQESAADQAAFRYLEASGLSAAGMVAMLDRLAGQELVSDTYQDPYVRTHPLSRDRVRSARAFVARVRSPGRTATPAELATYDRIKAKLAGFIDSPQRTLDRYAANDPGVPAQYARAIAQYRRGDLVAALRGIDGLIQQAPNDPYFHELKGQMLYENGRVQESALAYEAAIALLPSDPALMGPAAKAMMEAGGAERTARTIQMLERVTLLEPRNPGAWRQLGIGYGKMDRIGDASVALAEANMLTGRRADAGLQARRAQHHLKEGTPGWLKAEDILRTIEQQKK